MFYLYLYLLIGGLFGLVSFWAVSGSIETGYDWGKSIALSLMMLILWPLTMSMAVFFHLRRIYGYNPVQQMWLAPDDKGYWLVDRLGNKHAFGSATQHPTDKHKSYHYKPDELSINPNGRILSAQGVDYFGDVFRQSLLAPIVGVLPNEQRDGYYVFTQAGEVFAFGASEYYGSLAEVDPTQYGITWPGYRVKMSQRREANAATKRA